MVWNNTYCISYFFLIWWIRDVTTVRLGYTLAPEGCGSDYKRLSFRFIIENSSWGTHCKIVLRWNLTNEKSILVQAIAHDIIRTLVWRYLDVQITDNSTVYSTVFSGWQQRKHHSSELLILCEGNPSVIKCRFHVMTSSFWIMWNEIRVFTGVNTRVDFGLYLIGMLIKKP